MKYFIVTEKDVQMLKITSKKVTFLDVAKSLTDEHGDIRMEFYEQKYQSDVHLSKRGCQILVDLLYKKMCGGIGKF